MDSGSPSRGADAPEFLVAGLGNPGPKYDGTRHNLGFEVVDRLATALDVRLARLEREPGLSGRVKARVAHGRLDLTGLPPGHRDEAAPADRSFVLVKPWTFMNMSGVAVAALVRHYRIPPASIFVIYDDLNLPLGRMRIRPGGGPGGHNGMKSLVACLGTEGFPRLRIGIAAPDLMVSDMVDPDYVLSRFSPEERVLVEPVLAASVDVSRVWLAGRSIEELMNAYNSFDAAGSIDEPPVESGQ